MLRDVVAVSQSQCLWWTGGCVDLSLRFVSLVILRKNLHALLTKENLTFSLCCGGCVDMYILRPCILNISRKLSQQISCQENIYRCHLHHIVRLEVYILLLDLQCFFMVTVTFR